MTNKEFVEKAQGQYARDGEIEIDNDAEVSRADKVIANGAYVQAWVWVGSDEEGEVE